MEAENLKTGLTFDDVLLVPEKSSVGPSDAETFTVDEPGLTPVIFAPGHISAPGTKEMGCTFSADMSEFWFVRSAGLQQGDPWTLMVCTISGEVWSEPVAAPFDPDFVYLDQEGEYGYVSNSFYKDYEQLKLGLTIIPIYTNKSQAKSMCEFLNSKKIVKK